MVIPRVESVVSSPGLGCGHLDGSRDSGTFSRERRADPPRGGGSRVRGHYLGGPGEKPRLSRDARDACLIPGSGRVPKVGYGNPFQYSCLENPMDKGAW